MKFVPPEKMTTRQLKVALDAINDALLRGEDTTLNIHWKMALVRESQQRHAAKWDREVAGRKARAAKRSKKNPRSLTLAQWNAIVDRAERLDASPEVLAYEALGMRPHNDPEKMQRVIEAAIRRSEAKKNPCGKRHNPSVLGHTVSGSSSTGYTVHPYGKRFPTMKGVRTWLKGHVQRESAHPNPGRKHRNPASAITGGVPRGIWGRLTDALPQFMLAGQAWVAAGRPRSGPLYSRFVDAEREYNTCRDDADKWSWNAEQRAEWERIHRRLDP